jgi:Leucine-rich repeat (LRR) protein
LYCSSNELTSLPPLNDKLINLSCSNNQLTSLPPLNNNLTNLFCFNNPINEFIDFNNNNIFIKNQVKILNRFRKLFYLLKFKKSFIRFMWKSREKKIQEQFHPKHLYHFLENNKVAEENNALLDTFLNEWN